MGLRLRNLIREIAIIVVVVGFGYGFMCGMNHLNDTGYVIGDILSEHIAKCEDCSKEWANACDCPKAVQIQETRSLQNLVGR